MTHKGDRLLALLTFVLPLTFYLAWAPRFLRAEDDAFFVIAAAELGLAHAPGYPLWVFPAHLFLRLFEALAGPAAAGEWGLAWRLHLFSALLGAAAVAAVRSLAVELGRHLLPGEDNAAARQHLATAATVLALAFAFSRPFRQQTALAEVYTLHVLLAASTFRLALASRPATSAFVWALSLACHWPLAVLGAPTLLPALRSSSAYPVRLAFLRGLACGLACTLLLYGLLVRLGDDPARAPRGFGRPETFAQAAGWILRAHYLDNDDSPLHRGFLGPDDLGFALDAAGRLAFGLTPAVPVLAFVALRRRRGRARTAPSRSPPLPVAALAAVAALLAQTFFLVVLLDHPWDYLWRTVRTPYGVFADALLASLAASGLASLLANAAPTARRRAAACLIPVVLLTTSHLRLHDARDASVESFGRLLMQAIPPNALWTGTGDLDTAVFAYLRRYGTPSEQRPDVLDASPTLTGDSQRLAAALRLAADPSTPLAAFENPVDLPGSPFFRTRTCYVSQGMLLEIFPSCAGRRHTPVRALPGDLLDAMDEYGFLRPWKDSPNGFLRAAWQSLSRNLGAWRQRALTSRTAAVRTHHQARRLDRLLGTERAFLHGRLEEALAAPSPNATHAAALWRAMRRAPGPRLRFDLRRERRLKARLDVLAAAEDPEGGGARFGGCLNRPGVSATPPDPGVFPAGVQAPGPCRAGQTIP